MTDAQRDAAQKAYAILGEHFDRFVFAIEWEPDDAEGGICFEAFYKGGKWCAVGMAEGVQHLLKFGARQDPI